MPDPVIDPARLTARVILKLNRYVPPELVVSGQGDDAYVRRVGAAFQRAQAALGVPLRVVPQFSSASPQRMAERRLARRRSAQHYFRRRVLDEEARLRRLGIEPPDGWRPPDEVPAPGRPDGRRFPAEAVERLLRALGADAPVGPLEPYKAPDLRTWLRVLVPEGVDARRVRAMLAETFAAGDYEYLYVEPPPAPPPAYAGRDQLVEQQRHLEAAPLGIDARWAWSQPGAEGAGVLWADVEHDWNLGHEDLPPIAWGGGIASGAYREHGTAVAGVIAAVHDNCRGGAGIAPAAAGHVFSPLRVYTDEHGASLEFVLADAIYAAADVLRPGDVLLIEAQVRSPDGADVPMYLPAEVEPSVFQAIEEATSHGIIVVEAAGNGSALLDAWKHPDTDETPFARIPRKGEAQDLAHLYVADSGAILVGAGTSGLARDGGPPTGVHHRFGADRTDGSNYGRRVDCYAWGEDVTTCGEHGYLSMFGGTSAAAAIIAGAAAVINGARRARNLAPIEALEMRALLRDGPGTLCAEPDVDLINRMPDLRGILRDALGLATKLSLRDHARNDEKRRPFASPDIWVAARDEVRPAVVGDDGRPLRVAAGGALDVYVRVASNDHVDAVQVRVWAVPVDGAPDFARWRYVGSTRVEGARLGPDAPLVVGPLEWDPDDHPEPGQYALVAAAWSAAEPAPDLSRVRSYRDFVRHVTDEPAVAARLLTFAGDAPFQGVEPAGSRFAKLRFFAVGDPERDEDMTVRLDAAFDGEAWLEVPADVPAALLEGLEVEDAPPADLEVEGRLVRVPAECPRTLLAGRFPTGWRAALRLVVAAERAGDPHLAVEQHLRAADRDVVVGRLAWNQHTPN